MFYSYQETISALIPQRLLKNALLPETSKFLKISRFLRKMEWKNITFIREGAKFTGTCRFQLVGGGAQDFFTLVIGGGAWTFSHRHLF